MSRVPMMGFNPLPNPELAKSSAAYIGMGDTAENLATSYGIRPRAAGSLCRCQPAEGRGGDGRRSLADEIVPIVTKGGTVDVDGCPRPATTAETLAGLKPAFSATGTVTAGTSSPLTDGASAVLVASEAYARANGLPILARIAPRRFRDAARHHGHRSGGSSRKALARAGIGVGDLDVIELNEAFASQALACIADLGLDPTKINLDGGAIALGHPLGATGARIVGKAAALLKREGGRFALATQCIGGGQGIATVLEAI
jgi:acetyl-CoA acyltransferase